MKKGESINNMFERFTNIVGGLKALGKDFPNAQLAKKILYSPQKPWRPKVTAIEDSRNLNDFKLEKLIGSLFTYEMTLKYESKKEEPKNEEVKQKDLAIKSLLEKDERSTRSNSENEEDMAMIARKFNRFMKKKLTARKPTKMDVKNQT